MHASYHVHSQWSDGRSSLAELATVARATALAEWGTSDHIVLRPDGIRLKWSMDPARLPAYVEAVRALQADAPPRQPVRLGLELDYFPGGEKALAELLADYSFDYLMGSVHFVDGLNVDSDLEQWKGLSPAGVNDVWRGYWARIAGLARSGFFTFVGHLDLPKIHAIYPTADLHAEADRALDEVARAGMAVEVNTSGWGRACGEAYPSLDLLRACHSRGIPALVSADAHVADHLTRDLDRGIRWLRAAGYREVVRIEGRRLRAVEI